jgi:NAD(P)-dependent dehydrogenase (short-subunit alcohol dehydrogenase family)
MSDTRTALVTGGAKGMGREMALGLLRSGRKAAAVDNDRASLEELQAIAAGEGHGESLLIVEADLSQEASIDDVVRTVMAKFARIDILVNNAGVGQATIRPDNWLNPLRFYEVTPAQWRKFFAVNTDAPFMLSRAVAPGMISRKWGRIINVTTSLDSMLRAGFVPYGATKAATEACTAVMAADLAGTGVTANILVPGGPTNTAFIPAAAGFDRSSMLQPDIMVAPLLWLVSEAASDTTARRFIAARWDASLPAAQAAEQAGAPVAWSGLGNQMIKPKWTDTSRR